MNDATILIMPTMYIFAIITGFMLNTCSKSKLFEKLEEENYDLRWQNSILTNKLEDAERKLNDSETDN